ncbi:MAG: sulfite oxidase-like oxidoreductase [Chloroflexi bacterium]|nr:sulfite oxidase-like oxidoreductase [Chloroflexota bacterium]
MLGSKRRDLEKKMEEEGRLPPGQSATLQFPVLHYGRIPAIELDDWQLRLYGLVENEVTLDWETFSSLPTSTQVVDIHCVTRWSKFDTEWEGVAFTELMKLANPKPEAKFVIAHCYGGYTTNLPMEAMTDDDVMLAYKYDGKPLDPEHGFPVRTLVPKKYFWKSAKWVNALEFVDEDRLGFWERAGYHNEADPFKEQRFAGRSGGGGLW